MVECTNSGLWLQAGREIVNLASAAAHRSGMSASSDGYTLVLTGGVNMDVTVSKAVDDEVAMRLPGARVVRPQGVSPAMAAALMAVKLVAKGGCQSEGPQDSVE